MGALEANQTEKITGPSNTGQSLDISRLNRKERRTWSKSANIGFMIPGRHLPYVKKSHGEITDFYALREKETQKEKMERQAEERRLKMHQNTD